MIPDAVIVPDCVTVSFALAKAREHGGVLQTNGRSTCITGKLLPGYARISGAGDRCVVIGDLTAGDPPEAA